MKVIAKSIEQNEQVVGEICKLMCHSPGKHPSSIQVHDVCS